MWWPLLVFAGVLAAEAPDPTTEWQSGPTAGAMVPDAPLLDEWTEARLVEPRLLDPAQTERVEPVVVDGGTDPAGPRDQVVQRALNQLAVEPWGIPPGALPLTGQEEPSVPGFLLEELEETQASAAHGLAELSPVEPALEHPAPDEARAARAAIPPLLAGSRTVLATAGVVGGLSFGVGAAALVLGNVLWASANTQSAPVGNSPMTRPVATLSVVGGLALMGVVATSAVVGGATMVAVGVLDALRGSEDGAGKRAGPQERPPAISH